jgi:anti-sigma regulatory factor (Ser/Thr protein kinase)
MGQAQRTLRLRLCNEPRSTFRLRRALDRIAAECHFPEDARFELKVAATEALTNAIKGAPPEHAVEVAIAGDESAVEVEVTDRCSFRPSYRSDIGLEAETGRGIPLMLALVDEIEFASVNGGTRVRLRRAAR